MFGLFKKKSEKEKLMAQYKDLKKIQDKMKVTMSKNIFFSYLFGILLNDYLIFFKSLGLPCLDLQCPTQIANDAFAEKEGSS